MEELNSLVGLSQVKEEINSLINLIKVRKLRASYHMPVMDMTYHMVFTGNPGTGKTTVARLVAKIYQELGILSKGNLVETDRSGLVAGYVGQTALKVKEVVERALGGVLFIDEAYSLNNNVANDFGGEAIDTLVKMMEDHRDNLVVIVAGYKEEMKSFLDSNTGLVSRFNKFISFEDYSVSELLDILKSMAEKAGVEFSEEALEYVEKQLTKLTKKAFRIFGNARGIRNSFEKIMVKQANRLVNLESPTKEQLSEINRKDVKGIIGK
ncbi:MAG: AAA family ATPase [Acetivibrio sp.]